MYFVNLPVSLLHFVCSFILLRAVVSSSYPRHLLFCVQSSSLSYHSPVPSKKFLPQQILSLFSFPTKMEYALLMHFHFHETECYEP
ncbi:unnamed protein product [Hymenolepis diminuta]|uniref:Secreted protein n=1 Tax=Hymenolepis diminuta TaxID=6216 RepID=A0A0R3SPP6_HYMDI|nr:unnamed protein product [Hymenolepis diminuta]